MIKCIIVDDEPRNNEILQSLLETYCSPVAVAGIASSADEAATLIKSKQPDLVFLDIEMPGRNAFDLLQDLRPINFEIVFVTAFDNYAVKAFRLGAIDYLLKPVSIDELKETVEKVKSRVSGKRKNERIKNYLDAEKNNDSVQKITINSKDGFKFYEINNIVTCTAEGSYTILNLLSGEKVTSSSSLKYFEELLPEDIFFRIHHSFLINFNHIKSYTKGRGGFATMITGEKVDVSQRKKEDFLARFEKFR
jgi:two-component system, LytTR family, response regulator